MWQAARAVVGVVVTDSNLPHIGHCEVTLAQPFWSLPCLCMAWDDCSGQPAGCCYTMYCVHYVFLLLVLGREASVRAPPGLLAASIVSPPGGVRGLWQQPEGKEVLTGSTVLALFLPVSIRAGCACTAIQRSQLVHQYHGGLRIVVLHTVNHGSVKAGPEGDCSWARCWMGVGFGAVHLALGSKGQAIRRSALQQVVGPHAGR